MKNLSTLEILLTHYNGQILIPFVSAAKTAGIAVQTARNLVSQNKFPIKTQKRGSLRFVHIRDLADYIDIPQKQKGRPTKAEQMKKLGGGDNV